MCQPRGIEHLSVHLCKYASDVWQYPLRPVEPPYAEGVYASMQAFIVGMCCEKGECDLKELATYVCDLDAEYYPDEEE
ncbi:hypothetical protein L596_000406 [Steinernema carpocapsae]|nr:hypothetical protein L596_000406 [Steinernema carpocapsae]